MPVPFDQLGPIQKKVVTHKGEPILVLAGPGTGKTEVLTHRIAYLLDHRNIHPQEILAVTFSRRATSNMRKCLEELGVSEESQPRVSTLHSEALYLLGQMGLPFRFLVDDHEADMLMRDSASDLNLRLDYKELRHFKQQIQLFKGANKLPDQIPESDGETSTLRRLYERYEQLLSFNHAIDLDGLVLKVVRLLKQADENSPNLHTGYLLVDEYQDINRVEYEFIQIMAENADSLFVVGDDDQSIYGWRGADPSIIREFCDCFEEARIEVLERSFRCSDHILAGALSVVSRDPGHHTKPLQSAVGEGSPIHVLISPSEVAEATGIAEWISRANIDLDKIAVLCKMLSLAEPLSGILRGYGIDASFWRSQDLFSRDDVRVLLAYIRFLVDSDDNLALRTVVQNPRRGIGSVAIQGLRMIAEKNQCSLWDVICAADHYSGLSRWRTPLQEFASTIEQLREKCDSLDMDGTVRLMAREVGISRHADVERFREFAQSLSAEMALSDFLAEVNKNRGLDLAGGGAIPEEEDESVALMSMHSAKGLTYDVVFMLGMDEGIFPNLAQDINEQRRLCYVAMSRAKRELFLCHSKRRRGPPAHGLNFYNRSRFIINIPKEHIELVTPRALSS